MTDDHTAVESEQLDVLEREQMEKRREQIAVRAYELAESAEGAGDLDNWLRAERELHALDESV